MLPPESAIPVGDSDPSDWTVRNLRDQVSQLEAALLAERALLRQCQESHAIFEHAAKERLLVIERGSDLLQNRADEIAALRQEAAALRLEVSRLTGQLDSSAAAHAQERERLAGACREASRGMEELANRERSLTREILELRNEGLLHSIIRRLSRLFS
jgi:chromosome segregation ATPase